MMKFLKSNIILIFLIAFFSFIIVISLMKKMNIYEGMITDEPATPGPPAATPSVITPVCQAAPASAAPAPAAPTTSNVTKKSKNG